MTPNIDPGWGGGSQGDHTVEGRKEGRLMEGEVRKSSNSVKQRGRERLREGGSQTGSRKRDETEGQGRLGDERVRLEKGNE